MRTVVVGCGYTGRRILRQLPDARGWSRTQHDGEAISRVDIDSDAKLPEMTGLPFRIIYTVPPAGSDGDDRIARFLTMLPATNAPRRIVYLSTTGVYGDTGGATVDESAPINPCTTRAKRRVAAESALNQWCELRDTDAVVLRVPGIYGPGRLPIAAVQNGDAVIVEKDGGPGNRIHVDDLVRCCIAALDAAPGIYNVADDDARSASAFKQELAHQLAVPPLPEITRARSRIEMVCGTPFVSRRIAARRYTENAARTRDYPRVRLSSGRNPCEPAR